MTQELRYQIQNSPQTLQEALHEYHRANSGLQKPEAMSAESSKLFTNHDLIHVVFGLDTSLHDETLADTWTVFGSSLGFWNYLKYLTNPDAMQILQDISTDGKFGHVKIIREVLHTIPDVIKVWRYSRNMTQKWPWTDHHQYLALPLSQIRAEFGIQLIASNSTAAGRMANSPNG